jgi:hypothetical protein
VRAYTPLLFNRVAALQDLEFSIDEITKQEAAVAGIAKWKQGDKQNALLRWQEESGARADLEAAALTQPFEKEQWVLRRMRKFGTERANAVEMWNQAEAVTSERDYKGECGALRLWLAKGEYKKEAKTQYLDQRAQSQSEDIKKPTEAEVHALTMFVHNKSAAINFQHAFFHGGAGVPFVESGEPLGPQCDPAADERKTGSDGEEDDDPKEPPLKKLKGSITKLRDLMNQNMESTTHQACGAFLDISRASWVLYHLNY